MATVLASSITLAVSIVLGAAAAQPETRVKLGAAAQVLLARARAIGMELQAARKPSVVSARIVDTADPDRMQPAPAPQPAVVPAPAALGEDAEVEQAVVEVADAPEAPPDAVALALAEAARLSGANGRLKALHLLRRAAAENPRDGRVLKAWSAAAEELGAWGEARKVAEQWALAEGTTEARIAHARLLRATGNRERALAILQELASESPQSNEIRELIALYGGNDRLALVR
jgi:Flp pilus assembly protein TadD